jgi:hypothetical protein
MPPLQNKIKFLGHVVSEKGISLETSNTNRSIPTNKLHPQSFLGFNHTSQLL